MNVFGFRFNLDLKKRFFATMVQKMQNELKSICGSAAQVKNEHMIAIFDCWPVNISKVGAIPF
jgi:hypothetical protein